MKDITVNPHITIRQAMKVLNKTAEKCLLVVDENEKLLGTLTDGDLRRSILAGVNFSEDVSNSYHTKPTTLIKGKINAEEAKQLFRDLKLDLIPVVNQDNAVVDYVTWSSMNDGSRPKKLLADVPVVIMAGGKGTRLEPFTKVLPKPLVPINEKPIIEHIIERFTDVGVNQFILTVNYKARIMKAFFEELRPDFSVDFVEEQEPLGTAGSLKFLEDRFDQSFMVTNCDIIIKTDYHDLHAFHRKYNYDITLVASMKNYTIPYGTCELNHEGHLKNIIEKPEYDFLVNTGLYVLKPDVLKLIPGNQLYHITHLIEDVQKNGKTIGVYPIADDAWIDVGQWAEYQKAVEKI